MLRALLVVAILIPGLVAAVRGQFAALLLYLWYAMFRPQDWVYFNLGTLRLSSVIAVLVVAPCLYGGKFPRLLSPFAACMGLFLFSAVVAQGDAIRPDLGWEWVSYLARLILMSLMITSLCDSAERLLAAVCVVVLSLGFHSSKAGLVSLLGGGVRFADGFAGSFVDNNGYALAVVMILPFLFAIGQTQRVRAFRLGVYAAIACSTFTVVSLFSRAGFLALAVSLLTFLALQRRRFTLSVALVPVAAVLWATVPLPAGYAQRLSTIVTYEEVGETSAISRLHFWTVALQMAADHPLGIGLKNFEAAYDKYDTTEGRYGSSRSVHNSHLQALVEAGVLGALAYLSLFGLSFLAALRARALSRDDRLPETDRLFLRTMGNAIITSLVGFIVGGSFIALALNDLLWFVFAFAASLLQVTRQLAADLQEGADVPVERPTLASALPS